MKQLLILLFLMPVIAFASQPSITGSNDCVTVDFSNISLSEAVAFYSQATQKNIVLDSSIKTSIDLHLNCVSLTTVFDSLLLISGGVAETKNQITYILPKQPTLQNQPTNNQDSSVTLSTKPKDVFQLVKIYNSLSAELVPLLDIQDLSVKSFDSSNSLYLTGTRDSITQALSVISSFDKPKKQFMIQARLIATSDTFLETLGTSFNAEFRNASDTDNSIASTTSLLVASATGGGSLIFQKAGNIILNAKITAAIDNGDASLISEPKTIAIENKESIINQGLRIPYQTQQNLGGYSVNFIDAALHATPQRLHTA